jgi:uncharacterized repeat protein (TIGR03806 family)
MLRIVAIVIVCFIFTGSFIGAASHAYPEKLSGWNIFEGKISSLNPQPGVVPYKLNTPLYSDYAEKLRFIRLPKGTAVNFTGSGVFNFPVGTLLVKNFYYPTDFRNPSIQKNIIETRLLINEPEGWKAMTYVWNDEQTDAELEIAGDDKQIQFINKAGEKQQIRYVIPNQNQCKGCHNVNDKIMPIGPSASQLNGDMDYTSGKQNQISYWEKSGMLMNVPPLSAVAKTPVWNDPASGTLDARARAYLAINCSHCHRREGPAQTSGLFLTEEEKNPTVFGINKSPVAAGKGSGGRMVDILPGNATASILWYRMQTDKPGERMPELGRTSLHTEGLALIKEWIDKMKNTN